MGHSGPPQEGVGSGVEAFVGSGLDCGLSTGGGELSVGNSRCSDVGT